MNTLSRQNDYFRRARFLLSAPQITDLPTDRGAEIAVTGRSNAGKSSLLNALCDQRGLARTSRTPGRTQQIVVFDLGGNRRFLDLPGFGYAAAPREIRAHWEVMIPQLFEQRVALAALVVVVDIRAPLKDEEKRLLRWSAEARLPALVALNKSDKVSHHAARLAIRAVEASARALKLQNEIAATSAAKKIGLVPVADWLHARFEEKLKEGPGCNT